MTRSTVLAALAGLGLIVTATAAPAQTTPPVTVPAPSASPTTVVVPAGSGSGTTVVVPPGSTVIVKPPPRPATVAEASPPWCGGAYAAPGGTNFAACPGYLPR